jgi:F-type H+-transporting ATPase subunit b
MPEDSTNLQGVAVVPSGTVHGDGESGALFQVSRPMILLTWVTFILLVVVLYKLAWKPILRALDLRERSIRKSLDEADKARAEAEATETRTRDMLAEATAQAQQIVVDARSAAMTAAQTITAQASDEARALIAEARQEIHSATDSARLALRQETADLVVELAGKVVGANMDAARNRALVQQLMQDV